jgi:uncharacterized repeat protein (TIGR02543 family)
MGINKFIKSFSMGLVLVAVCFTVWACGKDTVTKYTVTFDTNGGSAVQSQSVEKGGDIIRPKAPTKTDYYFVAWYLDNELKTEINFANFTVTADITLYAKWGEQVDNPDAPTFSFVAPKVYAGTELTFVITPAVAGDEGTVTYVNNKRTDVGTQTATATIHWAEKTYRDVIIEGEIEITRATLSALQGKLTGAVVMQADLPSGIMSVTDLPSSNGGFTIEYSSSYADAVITDTGVSFPAETPVGTHTVTAIISSINYVTKTVTANFIVVQGFDTLITDAFGITLVDSRNTIITSAMGQKYAATIITFDLTFLKDLTFQATNLRIKRNNTAITYGAGGIEYGIRMYVNSTPSTYDPNNPVPNWDGYIDNFGNRKDTHIGGVNAPVGAVHRVSLMVYWVGSLNNGIAQGLSSAQQTTFQNAPDTDIELAYYFSSIFNPAGASTTTFFYDTVLGYQTITTYTGE